MNAQILNIEGRKKQHPLGIASPSDFQFSEGDAITVQSAIENPNLSLYCLDQENQRAIFVETPASIDLFQFPFFYQAQYENAVSLVAIPYEILYKIADDLQLENQNLIFIYSVGRCGSTLVSSVFNQVEQLVSFSEPDIYAQLVALHQWDGSNDAEIGKLVQSCTKILCKLPKSATNPDKWAIKLRSYGIEIADLISKYFWEAKTIFLYRDAETWIESLFRASLGEIPNTKESLLDMQISTSSLVPLVANYPYDKEKPLSYIKMLILAWLSVMERYLLLHQQGISTLAVRFQELTTAPQQAIAEIFQYCDLPTTDLSKVFEVLEKDSQAETVLSQTNLQKRQIELTPEDLNEIRSTLREHPTIQTSHFIVPNTLRFSANARKSHDHASTNN